MNFAGHPFLLAFLPLTLLAFHLASPRLRLPVLLGASLIFYGASGRLPLFFLLLSIGWAFATARLARERQGGIWIAVAFPLAVLYTYKYLGFTLDLAGAGPELRRVLLPVLAVSMPAGISFYTFQLVAYSVDVRDGKHDRGADLLSLATFVSLFPQLIAGPIVRYREVREQLERLRNESTLVLDWPRAVKFLSIGLFAKIFGADIPRGFHEKIADISLANGPDLLFSVFSYAFVIYYDFWSYSLMAIGLGLMFGIALPVNFAEPYLSRNPREFWRRWHVTLSQWLRDYVYIRLGGNRRYVRNILIVFGTCGLWHGAGLSFVVWGLYHALLVITYHYTRPLWDRIPARLAVALTFVLVTLGWPLFYLDLGEYADLIVRVASWPTSGDHQYGIRHVGYVVAVAAWTFLTRERSWLYNERPRTLVDRPVFQGLLAFTAISFLSYSHTFIYFVF